MSLNRYVANFSFSVVLEVKIKYGIVFKGSCSVLKPLKVKEMTTKEIFRKQMEEQTTTFPVHLKPHLVEKESLVNEVGQ